LYSQGRYQEATSEFEKAIEIIAPPRIEYIEKEQKEEARALIPALSSAEQLQKEKLTQKKIEAEKAVPEAALNEAQAEEKEYFVDIGDVLDISLWQIPDLSRPEVIVRPDGKISFPLIGDIKAEGSTLTQLDNVITEKLKTYVNDPEVSIMLRRFGEQANKVVALGEILSPGIYKFSTVPTIAEVVASAGGYTKYAVLNSIMIIRGDIKAKPEVLRINFAQVLKTGNLSENISLKPNDIVYVPRSFVGNLNTFLEILQPAMNEYMQTLNARHLQNTLRRKGGI